jgi:hypothetical protein
VSETSVLYFQGAFVDGPLGSWRCKVSKVDHSVYNVLLTSIEDNIGMRNTDARQRC